MGKAEKILPPVPDFGKKEFLSVLGEFVDEGRKRITFAIHGSSNPCLDIVSKHCWVFCRTLRNSIFLPSHGTGGRIFSAFPFHGC